MKGFKALFATSLFAASILIVQDVGAQTPGIDPDIAFDTTNNRYLAVFEQDTGSGRSEILGEFHNPDGSLIAGDPMRISDPRPTQGCFYGQFDEQNGEITTPSDCPQNKNPSVAYNNGQFMIVWEVHGAAGAPASSPDNQYINIFGQIVDAGTLNPRPGWEEGILISKVFIAANNAESQCGDKHACNDGQIQAWSQSINPDVAPRPVFGAGPSGFVVTWQTNKDFIGCADPNRRLAWSVYGRYVDQSFSATSTTNPPMFAVYQDDSTMADKCEPQSNVDNGSNPRIAFNQMGNDFVIAYEVARASGGNANIGAKRVTLNAQNVGQVNGSIMPDIVASVDGSSLTSPEVIAFKSNYYLFVSDGTNIRAKSFTSSSISNSSPAVIDLGGGNKTKPRASSTLGAGGQRPGGSNPDPERLVVSFEQGGNIRAAVLDENLVITRTPGNVSSGSTSNRLVEVASDYHDFVAVWVGDSSGDKVLTGFIDSADGTSNNPPAAPGLLTPNDGVTFAPTRAYLSWNASSDPEGDTVTYNVYFGENVIPATPQATGVTGAEFIIGPETQAMTGVTLQAGRVYRWKIEADDGNGNRTSSVIRTLNTDNSLLAWIRFDEDPIGTVCSGGVAGETICDYSGNNNHGTPIGSPTWLPPPTPGILGGALDLDGINDTVSLGDIFEGLPAFSVEVKLKVQTAPSVGNSYGLVVKEFVSHMFVANNSGNIKITTAIGDGSSYFPFISSVSNISTGTWYRAVSAYQGPNLDLIINGSTEVAGASGGSMGTNGFDRKIGALTNMFGTGNYFNGELDEVILYSKRLTALEALNNYNIDLSL